ncbi:hypothetical protein PoB_005185400 [Plakobranchus ocellatus]|uniref:Uncharacterized protein n=1 Tax=Plakobranchus ocellatus TaxID=259542 RepID=A0AAV4C3T9_9GAST|nr:hypothetical protein PoB_005185400 [Plakobranchus ocellatus]
MRCHNRYHPYPQYHNQCCSTFIIIIITTTTTTTQPLPPPPLSSSSSSSSSSRQQQQQQQQHHYPPQHHHNQHHHISIAINGHQSKQIKQENYFTLTLYKQAEWKPSLFINDCDPAEQLIS